MPTGNINVKRGQPLFGMAIRHSSTYKKGAWRVFFYSTELNRDKSVARHKRYMDMVIPFEVDIHKILE